MSTRATAGWLCGLVAVTALAVPAGGGGDVILPPRKPVTGPAGAKAGKATWQALHVGIGTQARHEHN